MFFLYYRTNFYCCSSYRQNNFSLKNLIFWTYAQKDFSKCILKPDLFNFEHPHKVLIFTTSEWMFLSNMSTKKKWMHDYNLYSSLDIFTHKMPHFDMKTINEEKTWNTCFSHFYVSNLPEKKKKLISIFTFLIFT